MSSDVPSTPCSSQEGTDFAAVNTVSASDKSLSDILSCVLQYEEAGTPLVVRGLNVDPNWSTLLGSGLLKEHRDGEHQTPSRRMHLLLNFKLIWVMLSRS